MVTVGGTGVEQGGDEEMGGFRRRAREWEHEATDAGLFMAPSAPSAPSPRRSRYPAAPPVEPIEGDHDAAPQALSERMPDGALPRTAGGRLAVSQQPADDGASEEMEWLKKIRGWLMVVAVQIAAMAYQAGINPPGGLWQDDAPAGAEPHTAGRPVARDNDTWFYAMFRLMNSVAFINSLAVMALLMQPSVYLQQELLVTLRALVVSAIISMAVAFIYSIPPQWPHDTKFAKLTGMYLAFAALLTMFIFRRRLPAGVRLRHLAWAAARVAALVPFFLIAYLTRSYPWAALLMLMWCVNVYLWL